MDPTLQQQFLMLYDLDTWHGWIVRLVTIIIIAIAARGLVRRLLNRFFGFAKRDARLIRSERRARTLEGLVSSLATFIMVIAAISAAILWLEIASAEVLLPTLGLFSAAFGLGARPLVSDYLAGITLLFEYSYAYGEKVEIMEVMGTVEHVGIRITQIRADSGELFTVPNGDVRVIRNFSRGAFSPATVRVMVTADNLTDALELLDQVANDAMVQFGDLLIERPEIISEDGAIARNVQLTVLAKARYGHGAELRRALMSEIHAAMENAGIEEAG